jgi:8-oxo-dGTP pyrophosphatase MutT (NUDIX family)
VVVAVVTGRLGVLAGRRRDGNPPWTFPGGKIEPAVSPEDAAVRETFEETGLQVRAIGVIGSRIHPRTGVRIVYVVAVPTSDAPAGHAALADGELTEVRWVGLAEAEELMDDMSEVVHQHLRLRLKG